MDINSRNLNYRGGGRGNAFHGDKGFQLSEDIDEMPFTMDMYFSDRLDLVKTPIFFSRAIHEKCDYAMAREVAFEPYHCKFIKGLKEQSGSTVSDWADF